MSTCNLESESINQLMVDNKRLRLEAADGHCVQGTVMIIFQSADIYCIDVTG